MRKFLITFALLAAGCAPVATQPDFAVITVIGTNDVPDARSDSHSHCIRWQFVANQENLR